MARSASWLRMTRGPKPMPAASLSGSLWITAVTSTVALPMVSRAPRSRLSRASNVEIHRGAECAVALRQRAVERHVGIEHDLAVERIEAIHRLQFDQRALAACRCRRHRLAWCVRSTTPGRGCRETPLGVVDLAVDQDERADRRPGSPGLRGRCRR